uniref:Uncharacterized protein n=1 Tax=Parascaris equorum TaxID=6256 RepID=A0A914RGZ5_PAREQ
MYMMVYTSRQVACVAIAIVSCSSQSGARLKNETSRQKKIIENGGRFQAIASLYFKFTSGLPNSTCQSTSKNTLNRAVVQKKKEEARKDKGSFLASCPPQYAELLKAIDKLKFTTTPNYAALYKILDENSGQLDR